MCKRLSDGKNELAAEWSQIRRERKRKFISAQKLCPSHHCTYRLEIDVQRGERSYYVEKPRGQCLKRVIDIPAGWFRMQHAYIDVFVACKMQSSKAVVSLAGTMHRRHFILEIPPFSFSFPTRFHLLVFLDHLAYTMKSRCSFQL